MFHRTLIVVFVATLVGTQSFWTEAVAREDGGSHGGGISDSQAARFYKP